MIRRFLARGTGVSPVVASREHTRNRIEQEKRSNGEKHRTVELDLVLFLRPPFLRFSCSIALSVAAAQQSNDDQHTPTTGGTPVPREGAACRRVSGVSLCV